MPQANHPRRSEDLLQDGIGASAYISDTPFCAAGHIASRRSILEINFPSPLPGSTDNGA